MCLYVTNLQNSETCGPGGRFRSSPTEGSDATNSSLSVDPITDDLNRTVVNCTDVTNNIQIGSDNICITGTFSCNYTRIPCLFLDHFS